MLVAGFDTVFPRNIGSGRHLLFHHKVKNVEMDVSTRKNMSYEGELWWHFATNAHWYFLGILIALGFLFAYVVETNGRLVRRLNRNEIRLEELKKGQERNRIRGAEEKEKEILSNDEKRAISCTNCFQGLNVPSSYSGKVECPSCKHQFVVAPGSIPPPVHEV